MEGNGKELDANRSIRTRLDSAAVNENEWTEEV
jgi:hypothetical protein